MSAAAPIPPATSADSAASPPFSESITSAPFLRDARQPSRFGTQRAIALGLGGLGVAGLAVGTIFLLDYNSKNDQAKKLCPTLTCEPSEIEQRDELVEDAKGQRTLSYVGFGGGGAALVVAAVVFFTAETQATATTGLRIAPLDRRGANGFSVHGTW